MLEERVVLISAADIDKALSKAIKEAKKYAKYKYTNIYGQKVRTTFLKFVEAFEITENLNDSAEVFSSTTVISNNAELKRAQKWKIAPRESKQSKQMRLHFRKS